MIPNATTLTEVDHLPGVEVDFTIGNPVWVMKNLAKLYSDSTTAPIREISTNAMDSHIMAGRADVPIEVTLPTIIDPYFVVQDYGLGLSEEEVMGIYTRFGDSTKRGSNDVNGMYGFGSKAPIAYTNQFTVEAVKNGIEVHAVISRRPDYSMVLKVVHKRSTDAHNGVKITIPVHNREEFRKKANDFYRFWRPGTVLVDGSQPEQAVGDKIDDNLYFSANPGTSYVVMGNVGYRIANPDALFRNARMSSVSFIAYVEGGAVEHTPSREDLEYTEHTKATLYSVISDFEQKLLVESKKQIEDASDHLEAWKLWNAWGKNIGSKLFLDMEYKGDKIPTHIVFPSATKYRVPNQGGYNPRYNTDRVQSINVDAALNALFITEFDTAALSSDHKRKARQYFEYIGLRATNVVFMKDKLDTPWLPKKNIVTWEDLKNNLPKAAPKPRSTGPRRPKGLFDFITKGGKHYAKPIGANADLFYITAKDANAYSVKEALINLKADDEVTVVVLAVNRIEKFKRDNFGARDFVTWAKSKIVVDTETLLTPIAKKAMSLGRNTRTWVERLDTSKIDDPKWKEATELMKHRVYTNEYTRNLSLASDLGMRYNIKEYRFENNDDSLTEAYPLLANISYGYNTNKELRNEIITYLNAAYAAKKGKP